MHICKTQDVGEAAWRLKSLRAAGRRGVSENFSTTRTLTLMGTTHTKTQGFAHLQDRPVSFYHVWLQGVQNFDSGTRQCRQDHDIEQAAK